MERQDWMGKEMLWEAFQKCAHSQISHISCLEGEKEGWGLPETGRWIVCDFVFLTSIFSNCGCSDVKNLCSVNLASRASKAAAWKAGSAERSTGWPVSSRELGSKDGRVLNYSFFCFPFSFLSFLFCVRASVCMCTSCYLHMCMETKENCGYCSSVCNV